MALTEMQNNYRAMAAKLPSQLPVTGWLKLHEESECFKLTANGRLTERQKQ